MPKERPIQGTEVIHEVAMDGTVRNLGAYAERKEVLDA